MPSFLPACLLSSWEIQFPRLLYVLSLKSSKLDSYLSGSLLLVDVCRICDHSEPHSWCLCRLPCSHIAPQVGSQVILNSLVLDLRADYIKDYGPWKPWQQQNFFHFGSLQLTALKLTKTMSDTISQHSSLQNSPFWIYCASCGFGFCQK